jgi:hypothetical protein
VLGLVTVTSGNGPKVAAVSGAFVVGHIVTATDTAGTLVDGGFASSSIATTTNINNAITAAIPSIPTTTPVTGTGTAGSVQAATGTLVLPNGTSATTQSTGDVSTKVATDALVDAKISAALPSITSGAPVCGTGVAGLVTGSCATRHTGATFTIPSGSSSSLHLVASTTGGSISVTVAVKVNGSALTGCTAVVVNSSTKASTGCTGSVAVGDTLSLSINASSGTDGSAAAALTVDLAY